MAQQVGSRRSMTVSLVLTIVIAFGSLLATLSLGWGPKLGLDLAGGLSVVYKPATPATPANMQEVVTVLTNRVNGLGVSGAKVNLQGKNVVVSVPGVTDARAVLAAVGQTAQLLFRPVLCQVPLAKKTVSYSGALPACGAQYLLSAANLAVTPDNSVQTYHYNTTIGPDPKYAKVASTLPANDDPTKNVILPVLGQPGVRYLLGPAQMTGQSIAKALAQQTQIGQWVVNYNLTAKGSPLWDQVAQANFHQELAIELDGVVQSAPLIQPGQTSFTSFAGSGEISGSFTQASAKNLAIAMQFGSLPVRLNALTTRTVSPTLGHSSLVAGLGAGLVGLALVLLYTILYYRALGLVIVLGARPHRLRAELRPRGRHGADRVDRHHGRQLHRVLRTIERRGPSRANGAHLGRPGLPLGVAHGVGGRHRQPARRGAALPDRRGRRARLRLLPRPLDADGRLHHLVLHEAARRPARPARIPGPLGAVNGGRSLLGSPR
jgi:protein-export membrane protein SecD